MAAYDETSGDELDHRLARDGSVSLFWQRRVLDDAVAWLGGRGYAVVEVTGADRGALLAGLAAALDFPSYFGGNLAALEDCLREVVAGEYGWPEGSSGLVVVLAGFDAVVASDAAGAHGLLDVLARQAREAALVGRRLLCLVQSDDPRLSVPPVGAMPVSWNPAEWSDSARGV